MSSVLTQTVTHGMPSVILGDFNEDLIGYPNSQVLSRHGFSQLVNSPTTDNGSLLDHVYFNRPSDHHTVQVVDAYYSDHDNSSLFYSYKPYLIEQFHLLIE